MLYHPLKYLTRVTRAVSLVALLGLAWMATSANANVPLADQPVFAGAEVPGNLALALSVEFPTAISVANLGDYDEDATYLGYFDAHKCYDYVPVQGTIPTDYSASYFQPSAFTTPNHHRCNNQWSGNFMNWATMQTIDPFRWALSGGYRSVDSTSQTILEKAWGSAQGAPSNFPLRGTDQGGGNNLPGNVKKVTPFNWDHFNFMIWQRGNTMVFSSDNGGYADTGQSGTDLTDAGSADPATVYRVYVRVRVCDPTTSMGIAGLESNCVQYGGHYKPEGLLQQYAEKIRYSALGYLAVNGHDRQGGVIRAPMGKIGQTSPRPEWDGGTGIMYTNPDPATASASGVSQSGVMNYLNKFGQYSHNYMMYDNVSELYYAAVRYFENMGNVPEWVNGASATELDGFPAVTTWSDPIVYSCQKNFVLGIGDDHTWYDYNVGGSAVGGDRPMPAAVAADTFNKADLWTRNLQTLEGMPLNPFLPYDAGDTDYIAGLAYGVHVNDIRPDLSVNGSKMTISTYWMDVEEYQRAEDLNQYYLATKYGGFTVPANYNINNVTAPLSVPLWDTGTGNPPNPINMNGHIRDQPDNYFEAGNAAKMVAGLRLAFSNIANAIRLYSTSFSLGQPIETSSGAATYAAQYLSGAWTGTITGSTLTFNMAGIPQPPVQAWSTDSTLALQLAGSGFDTGRNVVTWTPSGAVPFRVGSLTSAQTTALTPSYSTATSPAAFVNYLRGDQTNEVGSLATASTTSLRSRTLLLGDIVNARLTPVPAPQLPYSEASNPGYTAFKTTYASRPTMVYAAANDGMLHGFNGQLTGPTAGMEQFAYIPDGVIQGPSNTPQVNGLVALGNPLFVHHYYVDATPLAFDVDFANAGGVFSASNDWHTILVGGLGKGGTSFYAIDVTDPASMNTESAVAGKVLWEFSDAHMGYSFGAPIMVKTAKYGWVVVLTSGYNNSDGNGYLFFVNPQTGALLEKVATPSAAPGLAQATAFIKDYGDYTADSIYAGDLNGNMWRFDLTLPRTSVAPYPAPTLLATATDSSSNPQPITSAPLIEVHPTTRQRFIMFGTGQLLSNGDISSTQMQSFYAILDGSAGGFNTVSSPITRSALTYVPDVTIGIVLTSPSKGWYTDLGLDTTGNPPDAPSGYAWRVLVNPVAYNGIVSFTDLLPTGDSCSAGGHSRVYALNYDTGKSVLNSNVTGYLYYQNAITDLKIIGVSTSSTPGQYVPEIVVGTNVGTLAKVDANLLGTLSTRLLNWREVPTAD